MRLRRLFVVPVVLLCLPAGAEEAPRRLLWGGEPIAQGPDRDCLIYPNHVVVLREVEEEGVFGEEVVVKRRREGRAPAALCAHGAGAPEDVVFSKVEEQGRGFFGLLDGLLFVHDAAVAAGDDTVIAYSLESGRQLLVFGALLPVRYADGALQFQRHIPAAGDCESVIQRSAMSNADCKKLAVEAWACFQRADERLRDVPAPYGSFPSGGGDACQVELYEEVKLDLRSLTHERTGRFEGTVGFFVAG